MRPLTLRRLFLQCSLLAAILFVVVVVALKLGAVPVSLYGLGRDLISVLLHQTKSLSSDYGMIVIEIRLPRILLAIVVGASLSVAGTSFQAPRLLWPQYIFWDSGKAKLMPRHCSSAALSPGPFCPRSSCFCLLPPVATCMACNSG